MAIVVFAIGIGMLFFSNYIQKEVAQGKKKISKAQSTVDAGNSLFSATPLTKELGKGVTGSVQKKIDAGQEDVDYYESLSHWLQIGGIAFMIGGVGLFFIPKRR